MDISSSAALLLLFIVLSAVFSGTETALTHSRRARLHVLKQNGDQGAKAAIKLLSNPDRMLAAILLGNNFVNFAASSLTAVVMVQAFGEAGILYATVVMTVVIVMFSELLPKTIAVVHAEAIACFIAPWLRRFTWLFHPCIVLMQISVRLVRRLMRISDHRKAGLNRQELTALIHMSASSGFLDPPHQRMLTGNLKLAQLPVKALMTPRHNIRMLNLAMPLQECRDVVMSSPYSRYPVYAERRDNICGVIHLRHVFGIDQTQQNKNATLDDLSTKLLAPYYIPNNKNALAQLCDFQTRKEHMAIVVDEYGDIEGLITLEDILESIVGEIQDESDTTPSEDIQASDNHWRVAATASIHDINRMLSTALPENRATTIGGLIVSTLGKQPDGDLSMRFPDVLIELKWDNEQNIHAITAKKIQESDQVSGGD
ncbi:MAG: CNNM domain-containing protein [Mariprofundaceae bacterium]|nr:CNNM domain-containing protein [Mariprofundaceae bacterium]